MGIFDRFRGRDTSASQSQTGASELPSEGLTSAQASHPSIPELLEVPSLSSSTDQEAPGSSGRFYNPYEGLNTAVDGRSLRTPYKLPSQPEFLFSEEATVHRRSWSENLTYYTGTGYVTGVVTPTVTDKAATADVMSEVSFWDVLEHKSCLQYRSGTQQGRGCCITPCIRSRCVAYRLSAVVSSCRSCNWWRSGSCQCVPKATRWS